ncbi:MAG: hypothetical protein ACLSAF_06930 [Intestinimonas sp.]
MPSENRKSFWTSKICAWTSAPGVIPSTPSATCPFRSSGGDLRSGGESGSGKTTIGRSIIRIHPNGLRRGVVPGEADQRQDQPGAGPGGHPEDPDDLPGPHGLLNERAKVDYIVSEGLYAQGARLPEEERKARVAKALSDVGLLPEFASRFPTSFPAASASASASRGPSFWTPTSSWPTNPSPLWTCPSVPRCST